MNIPDLQYPSRLQTPTPNSTLKIKVSDIRGDALHISAFRHGRFYVNFCLDGASKRTAVATASDDHQVSWDEEFHFDTFSWSVLEISLHATHHSRADTLEGGLEGKIDDILRCRQPIEKRLSKLYHGAAAKVPTHIQYTVELLASNAPVAAKRQALIRGKPRKSDVHGIAKALGVSMGPVLWSAHATSSDPQIHGRNFVPGALDMGNIPSIPPEWIVLLENVRRFTEIVSNIAEIHPYAKFAWSVLTMAQKFVMKQKERDDRFRNLIQMASENFAFINKTGVLQEHKQTITLLTLQTTECAYFIRDYTKQRNFIARATRCIVDDVDAKIAQYESKFKELKATFRIGAILNTEITVLRIVEQLDNLASTADLNDLPYAPGARFDCAKQCLMGTREDVLDKIIAWVNRSDEDTESPRVMVLCGAPGSGKSAIAHTVAKRFDELKRLGSSFFFIHDHPERRLDNLFSTVTRDLADLDPQWRKALSKQLLDGRSRRKTSSVREQFEEFILNPARHCSIHFGPVVIVIDALDVSGDENARRSLLSLLSSQTSKLPSNFRILITTRPAPDIRNALISKPDIMWRDMDTFIDKQSALQDLYALFSSELSTIDGVEWTQRDELCRVLAEKADGSFEWAASACVFINDLGHVPTEQLSLVLSHPEVVCPSNYRATTVSPEHGATKSPSAYLRDVWHFISSDGGRTSNRVDPPLMERSHHPHLFAFFHGQHRNDSRTPSRNSHPGDFNDSLDARLCARPRGPRHLGIHPFPLAELDPPNFPAPPGYLEFEYAHTDSEKGSTFGDLGRTSPGPDMPSYISSTYLPTWP